MKNKFLTFGQLLEIQGHAYTPRRTGVTSVILLLFLLEKYLGPANAFCVSIHKSILPGSFFSWRAVLHSCHFFAS